MKTCQQPEMIPNGCNLQPEEQHNCSSWGTGGLWGHLCSTVITETE